MSNLQARVCFYRLSDQYAIEVRNTNVDDEWGLDKAFDFVRAQGDDKTEEPEYLYFGIVTHLLHILDIGYEVTTNIVEVDK